jgi:hypothetical protein
MGGRFWFIRNLSPRPISETQKNNFFGIITVKISWMNLGIILGIIKEI